MKNEKLMEHITRWRDQVQLIFCLGSNVKTLAKLSDHPSFRHQNIRLMGFTSDVDKLMDASDLLITKPGGMTCTEGLAKGIPMLFYNTIPGQEEENVLYFTQQGFGEKVISEETIDAWLSHLVEQYPEVVKHREFMTNRFHQYKPAECSQAIIEHLLSYN